MTTQPLLVVCDTNALIPLAVSQTERAKTLRQAWAERHFALFVTPSDYFSGSICRDFEQVTLIPNLQSYPLIDLALTLIPRHPNSPHLASVVNVGAAVGLQIQPFDFDGADFGDAFR